MAIKKLVLLLLMLGILSIVTNAYASEFCYTSNADYDTGATISAYNYGDKIESHWFPLVRFVLPKPGKEFCFLQNDHINSIRLYKITPSFPSEFREFLSFEGSKLGYMSEGHYKIDTKRKMVMPILTND